MTPADGADRRARVGPGPGATEDSPRADGTIDHSAGATNPARGRSGSKAVPVATLAEFRRGLDEQGLMDAGALDSFLDELPEGRRPVDSSGLASALVRAGKLSRYQASAILQRKAKVLAIGPYVILDKLGSGGMGMVFKARHRDFVDVLALKVLPPSSSKKDESVQRFRREARSLGRLEHPNLVTLHDIGESNGVHFLVMDYVEGVDLQRIVRGGGPMRPSRAIDLIIQAARGLGAAHDLKVIHRDIKPANLMVDSRGVVRVLDFGLSRISRPSDALHGPDGEASLTQSGIVMGTVDFLSPEQSKDSKRADHRADVYSLGCTLHYILTGRPPFPRETTMQRLLAHHQDPIPSLRDLRPEIPPEIDAAFRKMMAKDPDHRHQSMAKVIESLEACRAARPDGKVLLVFNDDRAEAKPPAPASPDSSTIPERKNPPTWPDDPEVDSDEDLSGYDLLPPQLSGLWVARTAAPKIAKPEEPPPKADGSATWRAIAIGLAAALLAGAVIAAVAGSRLTGGKAPPLPLQSGDRSQETGDRSQ